MRVSRAKAEYWKEVKIREKFFFLKKKRKGVQFKFTSDITKQHYFLFAGVLIIFFSPLYGVLSLMMMLNMFF